MLICDMCKREIDREKSKVEICIQGEYRDKLKKFGFNRKPDFCSLTCAIKYLTEFALLIKEPVEIHRNEGEEVG